MRRIKKDNADSKDWGRREIGVSLILEGLKPKFSFCYLYAFGSLYKKSDLYGVSQSIPMHWKRDMVSLVFWIIYISIPYSCFHEDYG